VLDGGGAMRGPDEGNILLHQFCERFGNIGKPMDKRMLIAKDTKHASDLLNSGKLFWPSGQAITFCGVNANSAVADNNAQVVNRGAFKFALRQFEEETLCFQKIEDVMDDASVKGKVVSGSNEDVVHVDEEHAQILVLQGVKQAIHHFLERQWGVRQSKIHDVWLVQPIGCLKCGFVTVFRVDLNVIITLANIQSSEEHLALELFKDMGDLWYGIDILDCPLVDLVVVLYWS
jgi:hypothetical protein